MMYSPSPHTTTNLKNDKKTVLVSCTCRFITWLEINLSGKWSEAPARRSSCRSIRNRSLQTFREPWFSVLSALFQASLLELSPSHSLQFRFNPYPLLFFPVPLISFPLHFISTFSKLNPLKKIKATNVLFIPAHCSCCLCVLSFSLLWCWAYLDYNLFGATTATILWLFRVAHSCLALRLHPSMFLV